MARLFAARQKDRALIIITAIRAGAMRQFWLTAIGAGRHIGSRELPVRPAFIAARPRMSAFRIWHDLTSF